MTPRERVLKTLRFEQPDRVAYDLMEGGVWPELMEYFRTTHNLETAEQVIDFLDTDLRWSWVSYVGPQSEPEESEEPKAAEQKDPTYSWKVATGPLADAKTIREVEAYDQSDPSWWDPPDFADFRKQWPDRALVVLPGWTPLFWGACMAFGMEAAMVNLVEQPKLVEAFVRNRHERYMNVLERCVKAGEGICDICWLADDLAGQQNMLINPDLWRKHIKPYLAEQVQLVREHGMYVLFHSCGAVRSILPDLIDIGVNALLVFQTTAAGMDAKSIAREFGGRLAFYGGMDVQQLLSYATPEEVEAEVRANVRAFADCGGYIVANSHYSVKTIKGENIEAMCAAAKSCTYPGP